MKAGVLSAISGLLIRQPHCADIKVHGDKVFIMGIIKFEMI